MASARSARLDKTFCIGIKPVDEKRREVQKLLELMGARDTDAIPEKYCMEKFTKFLLVTAALFAYEQKIAKLMNMRDSFMRDHFLDHERLLDMCTKIYYDLLKNKTDQSRITIQVAKLLKDEFANHVNAHDINLRDQIKSRSGIVESKFLQLEFI